MIRVLHICYGTETGGISSVILNNYSKLDKTKIHFDIATNFNEKGNAYDDFINLGIGIYYVGAKSKGLKAYKKRLINILKKGNYDAIHAHTSFTSWFDMWVAWRCGIKTRIVHGHNAIKEKESIITFFKRKLSQLLMNIFCTGKIACGIEASNYIFGKHSKGITILPNAIDTEGFRFNSISRLNARNELKVRDSEYLFGTIGRMYDEKNQIRLISIMSEIIKNNDNIKLVLIGDGDCFSTIKKAIDRNHLSKYVVMTGLRKDIDVLINAFDLFVLPSFYEGFPISAIEALSNGLPVLLSASITRELELFENVEYCDLCESDECWSNTITRMIKIPRNTDTINKVQNMGYDLCNSSRKLVEIYENNRKI